MDNKNNMKWIEAKYLDELDKHKDLVWLALEDIASKHCKLLQAALDLEIYVPIINIREACIDGAKSTYFAHIQDLQPDNSFNVLLLTNPEKTFEFILSEIESCTSIWRHYEILASKLQTATELRGLEQAKLLESFKARAKE